MEKPPPYNPSTTDGQFRAPPPPPSYNAATGIYPAPPAGYIIAGETTIIHQPGTATQYGAVIANPVRATDVIVVGGCPACRVGVLSEEFTLAGLCCAFLFFPIGLLCCLMMRERRCTNCGATFI